MPVEPYMGALLVMMSFGLLVLGKNSRDNKGEKVSSKYLRIPFYKKHLAKVLDANKNTREDKILPFSRM